MNHVLIGWLKLNVVRVCERCLHNLNPSPCVSLLIRGERIIIRVTKCSLIILHITSLWNKGNAIGKYWFRNFNKILNIWMFISERNLNYLRLYYSQFSLINNWMNGVGVIWIMVQLNHINRTFHQAWQSREGRRLIVNLAATVCRYLQTQDGEWMSVTSPWPRSGQTITICPENRSTVRIN